MKKTTINTDNVIAICLYVAFFVTSYASYMPSSIIDDLILIVIGIMLVYKVIKNGFLNPKILTAFIILAFECIFAIISTLKYSENAIESFTSFIKICILLMLPFYTKFKEEDKNKILRNFSILSIPNLLLGIWQFYQVQINEIALEGKYEIIQGNYFYRIQGGTGHPLFYAFLMVALILYFLYNSKFKFRYIMVATCVILCGLTFSSFAILIAIAIVLFKIVSNKSIIIEAFQKHSRICIIFALIVSILFIYKYMLNEKNTIRYVATQGTLSSITFNSFFTGKGFGSYLEANYAEAYLFRIIYENGSIGLLAFILIISSLISMQTRNNDYAGMFMVFVYILNLFINEGYIIPYIILMPIFCSHTIKKEADINTEEEAVNK